MGLTLPTAGTYTVVLDPFGTNTGTGTLTLYSFTDVTGPIIPNGPSVPVSLATPGQRALLTFQGTAGQGVSVVASVSYGSGCSFENLLLLKPDGSQLGTAPICNGNGSLTGLTLPTAGTYTVVLDPPGTTTGTGTLTLTSP